MSRLPPARQAPSGAGLPGDDLHAAEDAQVAAHVSGLADRLYHAWAQPDPVLRSRQLAECCVAGVSYANPLGAAVGVERFSDLIGEFLAPYPGYRPLRTSAVDVHHDRARWEWGLRDSIGQIVLAGLDVTTFDAEGLVSISTFFGPPPRLTSTITYGSTLT
ncbi:SnoaL-like domain-containing protein [Frankia sp. AiPs1]|uniref:hypothetical protein n=1 Tax=Frankia sp. AiPa1 TaxID=573492 RepID=UPI00202B0F8D|nr:hypothetical protein [Frankia sp. AiPa1]MCL9761847.1 hypothetical protein [Frankia sp. AiPa1]